MAKEELLEMNGLVMEVLPDSRFRVTLDNGHNLVAYTAGKMRKHHIRILAGDNVSLAPMFILFLLLEPFLVSGLTSGAVKQ